MVQREVADRMVARPGSRDYGILAVVMGSLFDVTLRRTVPATVFWPQPEVASAVVRLEPGEAWSQDEYRSFLAAVKIFFQQRRKQIGTTLRRHFAMDESRVADLTRRTGCDPGQRPQQLARETWRLLARELAARSPA
jgi:16S rRNA (adenine1518-N6/adenine1519-N6)-dimethyltransferase